jgi:hypothetical protein
MAETLYFTGSVNAGITFTGDGSASQIIATGTVAAAGPKGDTGAQGPQGPIGPAGTASTVPGPQGPQGIQGVPGTTNHSALTGLANDDHTQYHTDARGDVRYYTKTAADTLLGAKASTTALTTHTHVATTDLTATGTKDATTYLRGDNTWAVPAGGGGSGDMVLSSTQTNTGIKTFNTGTLLMRDPTNTFSSEPYSDSNPPFTLNLSDQSTSPVTPVAGQSTLYTTDGTNLNLKDNAGTTITVADTSSAQSFTNKNLTGAGNTFPTFNQSTTGSAATLTTARNVQTNLASTAAVAFNGSAAITPGVTGTLPVTNGGTGRATSTTAYGVLAAGTTATGAQQTIATGTSGQFLKSAGTAALAAFATLTAADVSDFSTAADARITAANKKTDSMSTNKLLGRGTTGSGAIEEITLGSGLSFTGTTLNASGGGGSGDMLASTYDPAGVAQQVVGTTATQTLTNKTLTAPKVDQIKDANGANSLIINSILSAVNYLTLNNNSTGSAPSFQATGADTNIDIGFFPKGSGRLAVNGVNVPTVSSSDTLVNKTLTAPALSGTMTGTYTLGGSPTFPATVVSTTGTQTLTNKTIDAAGTGNSITNVLPKVSRNNNGSTTTEATAKIQTGWIAFQPGANSAANTVITFPVAFTSIPIVTATFGGDTAGVTSTLGVGGANVNNGWAEAFAETTTGFTIRIKSDGAAWTATSTVYVKWVAIGI